MDAYDAFGIRCSSVIIAVVDDLALEENSKSSETLPATISLVAPELKTIDVLSKCSSVAILFSDLWVE